MEFLRQWSLSSYTPPPPPPLVDEEGQEAVSTARLRQLFDIIDRNNDGTVTIQELQLSCELAGLRIKRREAQAMLRSIQLVPRSQEQEKEHGEQWNVSFEEFAQAFKRLDRFEYPGVLDEWRHRVAHANISENMVPVPPLLIARDFQKVHHFVMAQCAATLFSRTVTAPMELIRMQSQIDLSQPSPPVVSTLRTYYQQQGIQSLFAGNLTNVLRMVPFTMISSYTYSGLLNLTPTEKQSDPVFRSVLHGFSSALATIPTHPFDVVRSRLIAQAPDRSSPPSILPASAVSPSSSSSTFSFPAPPPNTQEAYYRNTWHALKRIAQEEGYRHGLFKGLGAALFSLVPFGATYSFVNVQLLNYMSEVPFEWGLYKVMGCGVVAGSVATVLTQPLEVVKRQLMIGHDPFLAAQGYERKDIPRTHTLRAATEFIFKRYGARVFFNGLSLSFYKTVPMLGVSLLVREELLKATHYQR
eukprot:g81535.t1